MATLVFRPKWYLVAGILLLALGAAACSRFGLQKAAPTATFTPPPTETPLLVLPTYTPTPTPAVQPTATLVVAKAEEKPTLTPTSQPTPKPARPEVGGGEPKVAPVTYKVTTVPKLGNLLQNGSFEEGFDANGVGKGWNTFDNGGAVYDCLEDIQPIHVSHGQHAQLIRVMGPGQPDRFVGLYQTVNVVPGQTYTLTMHGVIQSSTAENHLTPFGHRIQWAIDYEGKGFLPAMDQWKDWKDTGWNDVKLSEERPAMNSYMEYITPSTDKLTLFIRGWTKWPIINSEAKYYLDGITLEGSIPGQEETVTVMTTAGEGGEEMPTTGGTAIWIPIVGVILVLGFALWEIRRIWAR